MNEPKPFRLPVNVLLLKPNIPAGCNFARVGTFVDMMRTTDQDPAPIVVRQEGLYWRVQDGRHRYLGAVIAGRRDVLAIEEEVEASG